MSGCPRGDEAAGDGLDVLCVADGGAASLPDEQISAASSRIRGELRYLLVMRDGHEKECAYISRRPVSARPSVTSSAYSRSPPTGRPLARRVTRTRPLSRSAR